MKENAKRTAISVIVPVYREHEGINPLIKNLAEIFPLEKHEIIVVDGSPEQETVTALDYPGVTAMSSDKGRGRQMNVGAARSTGEILLFLHADTILPENASELITDAMRDQNIVAGSFSLGIDSEKWSLKLIELLGNVRSWWTRVPYGDQAIFISRDFFSEIGGFRDIPIMEDLELMARIKKSGYGIMILPQKAMSSPRRWLREGAARCTLRNWLIRILYHMGVSVDKLAGFYK